MPYESLLKGYENSEPLPNTHNSDGRSLFNPPGPLSAAYEQFPAPIHNSSNGFDFHIYYMQCVPAQLEYARLLHERVRREFPELHVFKFFEEPIGPHPTAMFEVNTFSPHQTGAFFSWLTVHRGPCSVLIHPNTGDVYRDHTELVTWMGNPWPLWTEHPGLVRKDLSEAL
ncbi:uncharacterized protein STEHIDRAFT_135697 [Stereum hirsutum FP-91666 SS1]|uniref:Dopa 4,5-dioxygenase n=1 Tax=Stereum hirsutum (strain FP-91666) TaxID=721885 RepID=R7RXN3_STEHR|nr:uncharacterized protein STEHIDRAFT_135697 [Stereum hirsutum FP-91666 SS1]EIM79543.1 hypothetical protein STEHIDRAFT_135697 [Stereum hirsutum FP-91666 SS1]